MNIRKSKKHAMMMCFIDATAKIIEEEGIDYVTIRKVASLTGYNSATLYNYFENLDHLIFSACMKFTKPYTDNLHRYVKNCTNSIDTTLRVWECFCYYSFSNPKIFYSIFFAKLSNSLNDYITEYYEIYPQEISSSYHSIYTMLLKNNIYDRSYVLLDECAKEGYIKRDDILEINELFMLIYKGILSNIIDNEINVDIDKFVLKTMKYMKINLSHYLIKKHQLFV
ncbi:TetR/AcrR family transcriptional regulator [Tepidibacter hydrothermalis]|uniref:TetR/AcrR family transcriptional regulator n=1 Tax=Tepidibacter hydrothermalis TaxID=3036126 RepID=A0ABY8EC30_9FIRM|nr:TetR/AcrR family transcriptional regulator [Tepidibacter hydrothermalis]WFD10449.1 TetR/AcrR family transcriptional regulator [Tepidibacter hydrothermalis]